MPPYMTTANRYSLVTFMATSIPNENEPLQVRQFANRDSALYALSGKKASTRMGTIGEIFQKRIQSDGSFGMAKQIRRRRLQLLLWPEAPKFAGRNRNPRKGVSESVQTPSQ